MADPIDLTSRFELEGLLDFGASADVWLARDRKGEISKQRLALKLFRDPDREASFVREVHAHARAGDCPGLAPALAAFIAQHEGQLVCGICFPHVPGVVLAEWLRARQGRAARQIASRLTLLGNVLRVVRELHARELAHNDLGFGNLLVTEHGVRLLDLGAAVYEEISPPRTAGSAFYPDGCEPRSLADAMADDVFAFSVLAHVVLLERHPFFGTWPTQSDLVRGLSGVDPSEWGWHDCRLPGRVLAALEAGLRRTRAERPSAEALLQEIEAQIGST